MFLLHGGREMFLLHDDKKNLLHDGKKMFYLHDDKNVFAA